MQGKAFDDFVIGDRFVTARRTVTAYEVSQYVTLTGFFEPLFTDHDYIRDRSLTGRPIVPGGLTFALAEGLTAQSGLFHGTGMAFMSASMSLPAPLFVGESIQVEINVIDKRPSIKRGGGVVKFEHIVHGPTRPVAVYSVERLISDIGFQDDLPR